MRQFYRRQNRSNKFFKYFLFLAIGLFLAYAYYKHALRTPVDPAKNTPLVISIASGESVKSIARDLKTKQVVNSSWIFYMYVKSHQLGEQIKAGKFIVYQNKTIPEIVTILTGKVEGQIVITIPEGFTIKKIDARLAEPGLIQAGEFINYNQNYPFKQSEFSFLHNLSSLEGFLFPDTYFIDPKNFSLANFTNQLLKNFTVKIKPLNLNDNNLENIIIMASILEKEIKTSQDLPIVSGILWKRLNNNWALQADATLLYIDDDQKITASDLDSDSPYNTRKFRGLPPTPISNPGLKAITSAANPLASDYWFYLTKPQTGEVVYAKTNDEQNQNRAKYLD